MKAPRNIACTCKQNAGYDFVTLKYEQHKCSYDIYNVLELAFISLGYKRKFCKCIWYKLNKDVILWFSAIGDNIYNNRSLISSILNFV